jgi:hypothetical protein
MYTVLTTLQKGVVKSSLVDDIEDAKYRKNPDMNIREIVGAERIRYCEYVSIHGRLRTDRGYDTVNI